MSRLSPGAPGNFSSGGSAGGDVNIATVGGATIALGQALATSSLPVVLTAAQLTTLTPPAAITGYATSAKQDTLLTELQAKADLTETQPVSIAVVPSHAVTNAGTFVVQENGAALTSLQLIDDTVYASDAAISKVVGMGGQFDDTSPGTTTENSVRALRMSTRRELYVQLRDAAGNERGLNIDGSGQLAITVASIPSHAVTNAGTFVVQENGAALTALQLIDDGVYTDDTSTHSTGTSKGYGIMAVANPTDAAVDANDIGMVAMTLARAMKNDITTIAGTAPTTVGKLDVKGADGDVFVRQATASNLNMTEASAASILTSAQLIDDMIYTDDTSTHATGTSKGALMMAAATPTDTAVNANDIGALAMTVNRELLVQVNTALPAGSAAIGKLAANSGIDIGDVDVTTVGTITPGTAASSLGKAEDAVHGSGDVGVFALGVANEAQSTLAADGDYIGQATDTKGNALTIGNIAHDGVDAGAPVKVGGKAVDLGVNGTDVAANDRVNAYFTRSGQQFVLGGHQNIISKNLNVTDADGAQTDAALITVAAGTAIVVTKVSVMVDSATTATGGVAVRIGFGTANVPAADSNGIILAHPGISAGSGVVEGNGAGIIGIGASNEDLRVTCEDPVGGNIDIIVTYFTILIG